MSRSFFRKFRRALTFNKVTLSSETVDQLERWREQIEAVKTATDGPWFVTPEDLVGGWCIRTIPEPPSSGRGITIADFVREADARLIAAVRNNHMDTEADLDIRGAETTDIAIAEDGRLYLKE